MRSSQHISFSVFRLQIKQSVPVSTCGQYHSVLFPTFYFQELEMHNTLANRGLINYGPLTESQIVEIKKQVSSTFFFAIH